MKLCRTSLMQSSAQMAAIRSGALLCLLISSAGVAFAQTPSGTDLLRGLSQAERSAEYSATETVTREGAPTITMRVWKAGLKQRVEWLSPPVMRGDILVDNGTEVWRFHRQENAAIATKSAGGRIDLDQLTQGFETKVLGNGEEAGRAAWILRLSPRTQGRGTRKIWIDRDKKIRLRIERYDSSGKRGETAVLSSLQFKAIPDTTFRWTPPSGAKITRTSGRLWNHLPPAQRAAPWLRVPDNKALPSGYVFESAVVDKGEAWLRYTNGINRLSIFQETAANTPDKDPQPVDGGAWYWTHKGVRFLAAGSSEKDVKVLADNFR